MANTDTSSHWKEVAKKKHTEFSTTEINILCWLKLRLLPLYDLACLTPPKAKISLSNRFFRDCRNSSNLQNSCKFYCNISPFFSRSERQKVQIVISLLQGSPQACAFHLEPLHPALPLVDTFFKTLMRTLIGYPLLRLLTATFARGKRQQNLTAYIPQSGWNDPALHSHFQIWLSKARMDSLVNRQFPSKLSDLPFTLTTG